MLSVGESIVSLHDGAANMLLQVPHGETEGVGIALMTQLQPAPDGYFPSTS